MKIQHTLSSIVLASVIAASGCSKREAVPQTPPKPANPQSSAPAEPATPATATPAQTPPAAPTAAPAAPKKDPLQSITDIAHKQTDAAATALRDTVASQPAPAPATPPPSAPATESTPAPASSPAPAMPSTMANLQGSGADSAIAGLSASAGALQQQAEELLSRYSGELATLKTGVVAVKSYVDQHPELLPEAAKAKYQQLNTLMPELQSLVGTLKDYRNADLTTLVPKLQTDFAKAKSLYSEVRALLPEKI